jgi:serine phosphatase RsbU (regulator of sigma subunit)
VAARDKEIFDSSLFYFEKAARLADYVNDDSLKADIYNQYSSLLFTLTNYNQALHYRLLHLSLLHENSKSPHSFISSLVSAGWLYYYTGNYPKSLEYFFRAKDIADSLNLVTWQFKVAMAISEFYLLQEKYEKANEYVQLAISMENIKIADKALAFQRRGKILYVSNKKTEAEQNFDKAQELFFSIKDTVNALKVNFQRATSYRDAKDLDKALAYLFEYLTQIKKAKLGMDGEEGKATLAIAVIYEEKEELYSALSYYKKCIALRKNDKAVKANLAPTLGIANVYYRLNNYERAIHYGLEAWRIAQKTGEKTKMSQASYMLSNYYTAAKDYEKALQFHKTHKSLEDSLFNQRSNEQMESMERNFLLEKQKMEIEILNSRSKFKDEQIKSEKRLIYLLLSGLAIICGLALFLWRTNKQRRRINFLLHRQNKAISKQKQFLEEQKNEIERKNEEIMSGIKYAKRIQGAMLPSDKKIESVLPELFVYYNPKDIVSGDFYWIEDVSKQKEIIALIDCTGHGVAGAFMSMIGMNLMNNIVRERNIYLPHHILSELHEGVISSLTQQESENEDGMDAAVCLLDQANKKLIFAGAKQYLVYFQDGIMQKVRGDRFSLGGIYGEEKRVFTPHVIDISKPTTCYLFTDGCIDQFGGPHNKKYSMRNLESLLILLQSFPFYEQKQIIYENFHNWIGNNKQVDDMTLIAFQI